MGKEITIIHGNRKRLGLLAAAFLLVAVAFFIFSFLSPVFKVNWLFAWRATYIQYGGPIVFFILFIVFLGMAIRNKICIYENDLVIMSGLMTTKILYSEITKLQERTLKEKYYYDIFTAKTNRTISSTSYVDLKEKFAYAKGKINQSPTTK